MDAVPPLARLAEIQRITAFFGLWPDLFAEARQHGLWSGQPSLASHPAMKLS